MQILIDANVLEHSCALNQCKHILNNFGLVSNHTQHFFPIYIEQTNAARLYILYNIAEHHEYV